MMRRGPPVMTWPRSWLTAVVALVTRAAGGDPDAWAEIVELYTPLVWSICTRFKLSSVGTKNVAQMIWLLLAERLGKLRDPAALPGRAARLAGHNHAAGMRPRDKCRRRIRTAAGQA